MAGDNPGLWWCENELATLQGETSRVETTPWRSALRNALVGTLNLDRARAETGLAQAAAAQLDPGWAAVRRLLQLRYDLRWGDAGTVSAAKNGLLQLIESTTDQPTLARAWHTLGVHHIRNDEPWLADRALTEALRLAEKSPTRAWILDSLGQAAMWQGAWVEARYLFRAAGKLKAESRDELGIAITLGNVAQLELGLGNPRSAAAACEEALQYDRLPALTRLRAATLLLQCRLDAGDPDQDDQRRVKELTDASGPEQHHLKGFAALALARAEHRDAAACENWLRAAESNFTSNTDRAMVNYWRARLLPDRMPANWAEDTRVLLSSLGTPSEAELLTELLLAERAFQQGNAERGHAFLHRADRVAMRAGNPLWVERVDRIFRQLDPGGFSDRVTARFTGRPPQDLSRSREEVVTSIFADVVGFTRRFEKQGAQQVMDTIRSVFERAVPLFERFKVRPHQYQGDGLVAEAQGEGHEARALDFGWHLLCTTNRASLARISTGDEFGLQVRIGIATGPVITGALGSQYKLEYLSIGRSVNMAARLQAQAEPGALVCAEATGVAAGLALPMEDFELKGFSGRQRGFRVSPGLGVYTTDAKEWQNWKGQLPRSNG